MKRIAVLCSNPDHPVMPFLRDWSSRQAAIAEVTICHDLAQVRSGDFLFLISCTQIVPPSVRQRFDMHWSSIRATCPAAGVGRRRPGL